MRTLASVTALLVCAACAASTNTTVSTDAGERAAATKPVAQAPRKAVPRPLTDEALDAVLAIMEASRAKDQERILSTMQAQRIDASALEDLLATVNLTLRYVEISNGMQALERGERKPSSEDRAKIERARDVAEQRLSTYFAPRGGIAERDAAVIRVRSKFERIRQAFPPAEDEKAKRVP